jgi:hypothetical protein
MIDLGGFIRIANVRHYEKSVQEPADDLERYLTDWSVRPNINSNYSLGRLIFVVHEQMEIYLYD